MAAVYVREIESPLGPLRLRATAEHLTGVFFEAHGAEVTANTERAQEHPVLDQAARELADYFATGTSAFATPLAATGTKFQETVWSALREIPTGQTVTYGDLARRIGKPSAVRAVGLANGKNPLSIFVPCHRVIGANGKLTGYAGGLPAKRWLLEHERSC